MKKLIFSFSFFLFLAVSSFGQGACECLDFYSGCSGKPLLLGPTEYITVDGRDVPVGTNGKVCYDFDKNSKICFGATGASKWKNWSICKRSECSIQIFPTLPPNPSLNGQLVGNWPYVNTGSGNCSPIWTNPLNSVHSVTQLNICPADKVTLTLPDFYIPVEAGYCLTVSFERLDGTSAGVSYFDAATVAASGGEFILNTTGVTSDIHIMTMSLTCCNGGSLQCTGNTTFSVYVEFAGDFSYKARATMGYAPNHVSFVPKTSKPSTLLIGGTSFHGFYFNQLTFTGYNVVNRANTDLNWSFNEVDCESGNDPVVLASGVETPVTGLPFTLPIFVPGTVGTCTCYRLDFNYEEKCAGGIVTDSYFFKQGDDCPPDALIGSGGTERSAEQDILATAKARIKVVQNPIEGDLVLSFSGEFGLSDMQLQIFNMSGQLVTSQNLKSDVHNIHIPFSSEKGMYFYTLRTEKGDFSGKFVN